MEKTEIELRAYQLITIHGLVRQGWDLRWMQNRRNAAYCDHHNKEIGLSEPILTLNDWPVVRDAILHEIAHGVLARGHHHDSIWRVKFIEIGGSGERQLQRCVVPPGRYELRCGECRLTSSRYRAPKRSKTGGCRSRLICRNCKVRGGVEIPLMVIDTVTGKVVQ